MRPRFVGPIHQMLFHIDVFFFLFFYMFVFTRAICCLYRFERRNPLMIRWLVKGHHRLPLAELGRNWMQRLVREKRFQEKLHLRIRSKLPKIKKLNPILGKLWQHHLFHSFAEMNTVSKQLHPVKQLKLKLHFFLLWLPSTCCCCWHLSNRPLHRRCLGRDEIRAFSIKDNYWNWH